MAWPPQNGTSYLPSNGEEGLRFLAEWCDRCAKRGPDDETGCPVLSASFIGPIAQWIWREGKPACLVFQALPPGPEDAPAPDPRQLTMEVSCG